MFGGVRPVLVALADKSTDKSGKFVHGWSQGDKNQNHDKVQDDNFSRRSRAAEQSGKNDGKDDHINNCY